MQPNQPDDPGSATLTDTGPSPQPPTAAAPGTWMAQTALYLPLTDRTDTWRPRAGGGSDALVVQRVVAAVAGLSGGILTGLWLLLSASPAPAGAAKPVPVL